MSRGSKRRRAKRERKRKAARRRAFAIHGALNREFAAIAKIPLDTAPTLVHNPRINGGNDSD